jgi:hypothetical protein
MDAKRHTFLARSAAFRVKKPSPGSDRGAWNELQKMDILELNGLSLENRGD